MKKIFKIILVIIIALLEINTNALYESSSKIENHIVTEEYNIKLNGNGGIFTNKIKL